ncbi:MAG: hypothetical protein KC432_11965 [Thermomicrobiales bacterium]|nr:hypothetical protein [Thermomicrobiales bacterium]
MSNGPESIVPNRAGRRTGVVSEFTIVAPLAPGGAQRLRMLSSSETGDPQGPDNLRSVRTLHDLRWVIFDNDTRAIFATTYDGDWDSYIDDFATGIPDMMDAWFSVFAGYPGITHPTVKDYFAAHQVTAALWFSAYPTVRTADIDRNQRVARAVEALLDAANP